MGRLPSGKAFRKSSSYVRRTERVDSMDGRGACVTISCWSSGCWSATFCSSCLISAAESVSSNLGSESGLPTAAPVRVRLMPRGVFEGGSGRLEKEGDGIGEVDMRSWSGSSEAFRFRFDILGVDRESGRHVPC